jgi:hypothetical protein
MIRSEDGRLGDNGSVQFENLQFQDNAITGRGHGEGFG